MKTAGSTREASQTGYLTMSSKDDFIRPALSDDDFFYLYRIGLQLRMKDSHTECDRDSCRSHAAMWAPYATWYVLKVCLFAYSNHLYGFAL